MGAVRYGGNFPDTIRNHELFIDKSMFVEEFIKSSASVQMILRPSGFGKSMNLSMLESFLSLDAQPGLFLNLEIWKDQEFCEAYYMKYPVINISFKNVKGNDFYSLVSFMWSTFLGLLRDSFSDLVEDVFTFIGAKRNETPHITSIKRALLALTFAVHRKYQKRVILLIDEYDTPLNHARLHGFLREASGFMGTIYSAALKENGHLERACLMGIYDIREADIWIVPNNVVPDTVNDDAYSKYFGVTSDEIRRPY